MAWSFVSEPFRSNGILRDFESLIDVVKRMLGTVLSALVMSLVYSTLVYPLGSSLAHQSPLSPPISPAFISAPHTPSWGICDLCIYFRELTERPVLCGEFPLVLGLGPAGLHFGYLPSSCGVLAGLCSL